MMRLILGILMTLFGIVLSIYYWSPVVTNGDVLAAVWMVGGIVLMSSNWPDLKIYRDGETS